MKFTKNHVSLRVVFLTIVCVQEVLCSKPLKLLPSTSSFIPLEELDNTAEASSLTSLSASAATTAKYSSQEPKASFFNPEEFYSYEFPSNNIVTNNNNIKNSSSKSIKFQRYRHSSEQIHDKHDLGDGGGEITRFWKFDKELVHDDTDSGSYPIPSFNETSGFYYNNDSSSSSFERGGEFDDLTPAPSVQSRTILTPEFLKNHYDHSEHFQEQPPADDRILMRHSTRSRQILHLPVYTPLYRKHRIITHVPSSLGSMSQHIPHLPPHQPNRIRPGKFRRGSPPRNRRRNRRPPPPHRHPPVHVHHHHPSPGAAAGPHKAYVPAFVSYGPIMSPGPPYHHPGGGGHNYGQDGGGYQDSIQNVRYIPPAPMSRVIPTPSAAPPPLPPFMGQVVGTYLPPSMNAKQRMRPDKFYNSSPRNSYFAPSSSYELPTKNYSPPPPKNYHWKNSLEKPPLRRRPTSPPPPPNSYGPPDYNYEDEFDEDDSARGFQSPKALYDFPAHTSPAPSMLYVPMSSSPIPPTPLYGPPGKEFSPVIPMNYGSPMHNFGPPMSSYGQPPPIFDDDNHFHENIYKPKDDWNTYGSSNGGDGGGGGGNLDENGIYNNHNHYNENEFNEIPSQPPRFIQKNRRRKNPNRNKTRPNSYKNTVADDDSIDHHYYDKVEDEQLTKKFRPPIKPFKPRRKPLQQQQYQQQPSPSTNNYFNDDNYNEYSTPFQQQIKTNNEPVTNLKQGRPEPNFNTNYNSPGLYLDPKIVDWTPFNSNNAKPSSSFSSPYSNSEQDPDQYRYKRNRKFRPSPSITSSSTSSSVENNKSTPLKYTTLPDSFKNHRPDPEHVKYPKLTYDASTLSKRVIRRRPSFVNRNIKSSANSLQLVNPSSSPSNSTTTSSSPSNSPNSSSSSITPSLSKSQSQFMSKSSSNSASIESQTDNHNHDINDFNNFISKQVPQFAELFDRS